MTRRGVFFGIAGAGGLLLAVLFGARCVGKTGSTGAPSPAHSALSQEIQVALRWTDSDEPQVRGAALVLLRRLSAAPMTHTDRKRVIERMKEIVASDVDPSVIASALSTVSALDAKLFRELVFDTLSAGSVPAKRGAAGLVSQAMTPEYGARLVEILTATFTDGILAEQRMQLVQGLERVPTDGGGELVARMIGAGSDPYDRDRMAQILAVQPAQTSVLVGALMQLSRGDSAQYHGRQTLVTTLGRRGDRRASDAIVVQLESQNESLRVEALRSLARLQDPIAAPALIQRFRRATPGSNEERVIKEILQAGYPGLTLLQQVEADPSTPVVPKLTDDYQTLLAERARSLEPPAQARGAGSR